MSVSAPPLRRPQAVLFACRMNAVRSPMAAALLQHYFPRSMYVRSAGVLRGEHDPFVDAVMGELGLDLAKHQARTFEDLMEEDGFNFDLVVSLSPEAHHRALDLTRTLSVDTEYWPVPDPTYVGGNREQRLAAYRQARDLLAERIRGRFVTRAPVLGAPGGTLLKKDG